MHVPLPRRPIGALLAVAMSMAPLASVLAGPAEDRATARELAKIGVEAEQNGDCATAIDKLERAESLFHAPVHLQYLARCYAKTGRLVEATETWRKLTLETLPPNAPPAFKAAVAEAQVELPKIEPRLAHLTIKPQKSYPGLLVEVDDKVWPSAAFDVSRVIDPGKHQVRMRATGYLKKEQSIDLKEGATDTLVVDLVPGGDGSTPVPVASGSSSSTASSSVPTSQPPPIDSGGGTPWKTMGLIGASVGGALLVGGVITGVSASSKFSALERDCPNRDCPRGYDLAGKQSSIRSLETVTNILLISGGVLAAAGITIFVLAPSGTKKEAPVTLHVQPICHGSGSSTTCVGGNVGLSGSF